MKTKNQFKSNSFITDYIIVSLMAIQVINAKTNVTIIEKAECFVEYLTKKTTPPQIDLYTAVLKNDIKALKQHIAAKSDLNVKESFGGSTPLISATLFGKTEIAKLLIDAEANLNLQNNDGSTALITAAFFCRPEIVKRLLAKKAKKSIKNNYGQTALETIQPSFDKAKPVYDALKCFGSNGIET